MAPVFAHGRLRLYLLKLLDEAPRHGYEVIRLLEERFQGLYAPSAGTVYPRLAKLEAEGLVNHTTEGGRKVYSITDAGRAELADRQGELAELEVEIRESLAALAADIREDVSGSARDLRREMREQARHARASGGAGAGGAGAPWEGWGDKEGWRQAKEEMRRAKEEWKEQARKAKRETQQAQRQAKEAEARAEAAEEVRRIARQVQDQVQSRARAGDWPGAVREGMSQLAREMGNLGRITGYSTAWPPYVKPDPAPGAGPAEGWQGHDAWAEEDEDASGENPSRTLERLLDRFRDEVRDAARDHGVTPEQLREARRHLSTAAAHIGVLLRDSEGSDGPGPGDGAP
ncbi:PadR family transcriptional regulator [Streptomyces daliensis]